MYTLDERRRAALADVDNASFSCVFRILPFCPNSTFRGKVGST